MDWRYMSKHLNFQTLILIAFLARLLITGASIGDAIVIIGLSALYGYCLYQDNNKEAPANKELREKVSNIEEQLKASKDKLNALGIASGLKR